MYICMYLCVQVYVCIHSAGENVQATTVLAGPVFSQGESRIPFLQKAGNGQSASVILDLAGLIILSYI